MSASNALALIAILNDIAGLLVNGSAAYNVVAGTLAKAQAEGRDVSEAELDAARAVRLTVIGDLHAEIARRQAEGPAHPA